MPTPDDTDLSKANSEKKISPPPQSYLRAESAWQQFINKYQFGWRHKLLTFFILVVVSFVMLWLGDKLSSQGMALTRYMATTQAPITGKFYPEVNREKITIIIYDDAYLRQTGSAWPIPYADYAAWLLRLTADPHAKPKAIFIDITFAQEREESIEEFQAALCSLQHELAIPVFLAALISPLDGRLHIRSDLENTKNAQGQPCFTLVGVDSTPDPIDRQSWNYSLTTHIENSTRVSGPAPTGNDTAYRSAALVLAQDVALLDLGVESSPLALVWGAASADQTGAPEFNAGCNANPSGFLPLMPDLLRQIWSKETKTPICPYHTSLSMVHVAQHDEAELAPYLKDRYLMIGANINGYNDFAHSPVHGMLPGIFVHAMALDNLLTYGSQYKQHESWSLPPSASMLVAGLIAIAAVFLIHLLFRWLRSLLRALPWIQRHFPLLAMTPEEHEQSTLRVRLLNAPIRFFMWLLRLFLQATAAMLLIAFMQWKFRVGMLPVVELVGMTILAEGLSYADKVRVFFFGKPPLEKNS